jgi:hypothetical protein
LRKPLTKTTTHQMDFNLYLFVFLFENDANEGLAAVWDAQPVRVNSGITLKRDFQFERMIQ